MASAKPRGRPPADGNFIVWTQPLVDSLLRLRFEKYAGSMAAARGTKALRMAWAEMADDLTQQNGDVVSVEQCRNKLKALRNKWLAYHAGMASEPVCLALMDTFWGTEKEENTASKSPRQSRPHTEHRKNVKKPRLISATSDAEGKTDIKSLIPIAPAPAPIELPVVAPVFAPVTTLTPIPAVTIESVSTSASTSTMTAEVGAEISLENPAQLMDVGIQANSQGSTDIASFAAEAARPKDNSSVNNAHMTKVEKLIDDHFAKVLERQEKQIKLAEEQNQLLARILAALQRSEHHDHTDTLE